MGHRKCGPCVHFDSSPLTPTSHTPTNPILPVNGFWRAKRKPGCFAWLLQTYMPGKPSRPLAWGSSLPLPGHPSAGPVVISIQRLSLFKFRCPLSRGRAAPPGRQVSSTEATPLLFQAPQLFNRSSTSAVLGFPAFPRFANAPQHPQLPPGTSPFRSVQTCPELPLALTFALHKMGPAQHAALCPPVFLTYRSASPPPYIFSPQMFRPLPTASTCCNPPPFPSPFQPTAILYYHTHSEPMRALCSQLCPA